MIRCRSIGIEYLLPIFSTALGPDDIEATRLGHLFNSGNLTHPLSLPVNTDINKRIRYLE